MPARLETTPVIPNAVYYPQILLQTAVVNGKLVTSGQIHFAGAAVDEDGNWTPSGHGNTVYLPDLQNLEQDLQELAPQIGQIYGGIVAVMERLNAIRKVL